MIAKASAIVSRELALPCQLIELTEDMGTVIVTAIVNGRSFDVGYQSSSKPSATWLAEWVMEVYMEMSGE